MTDEIFLMNFTDKEQIRVQRHFKDAQISFAIKVFAFNDWLNKINLLMICKHAKWVTKVHNASDCYSSRLQ